MTQRTALLAHGSAELYGSDRVFLESVHALTAADWRVVVTVPGPGPLTAAVEAAGASVALCPTPVLRKAALRPAGFVRLLADALRGLGPMVRLLRAQRPEVVYVNTVTIPLWPVLARLFRLPVLAHVHEAEDAVPAPVRTGLAVPLLAANTVVVNSEATGAVLRRALPRLGGRTRLVYNGVAGPSAAPPEPAAEPADPVRILLVGRISPRKGTDTAVAAMALLSERGPRARLDIVGSVFAGYEWFEAELRATIERAGLTDSVRFHGFHAEVWDAYRRADLAIVPSRVEPFGNTSVEAQLAGLPVIVTDAQGLPETVDGGRLGTVVPADDPAALADAIAGMTGDWPAARERALLAGKEAGVRFAPDRYRETIAELVAALPRR